MPAEGAGWPATGCPAIAGLPAGAGGGLFTGAGAGSALPATGSATPPASAVAARAPGGSKPAAVGSWELAAGIAMAWAVGTGEPATSSGDGGRGMLSSWGGSRLRVLPTPPRAAAPCCRMSGIPSRSRSGPVICTVAMGISTRGGATACPVGTDAVQQTTPAAEPTGVGARGSGDSERGGPRSACSSAGGAMPRQRGGALCSRTTVAGAANSLGGIAGVSICVATGSESLVVCTSAGCCTAGGGRTTGAPCCAAVGGAENTTGVGGEVAGASGRAGVGGLGGTSGSDARWPVPTARHGSACEAWLPARLMGPPSTLCDATAVPVTVLTADRGTTGESGCSFMPCVSTSTIFSMYSMVILGTCLVLSWNTGWNSCLMDSMIWTCGVSTIFSVTSTAGTSTIRSTPCVMNFGTGFPTYSICGATTCVMTSTTCTVGTSTGLSCVWTTGTSWSTCWGTIETSSTTLATSCHVGLETSLCSSTLTTCGTSTTLSSLRCTGTSTMRSK
mmetsp:Transcript_110789/g.300658  ORF Transcript_110789/g.300658 Transcript_110789/m.300658 type:complete len:503 (-) Transcript_110789:1073-2581(-)